MRIGDLTRLSWDQVRRRKVVTALCAAGLSIGCAAIILALSIGESAQKYIETEMNSFFKMDEITVTANEGVSTGRNQGGQASSGNPAVGDDSKDRGKLTDQKLAIMKNMKHVTAVAPFQQINYMEMSTTDNRKSYVEVIGTDLNMLEAFDKPFMNGGPSDLIGTIVLNYGATLGLADAEARDKLIEQLSRNPYDSTLVEQYEKMNRMPASLFQRQVQFLGYLNDGKAIRTSQLRVTGVLKKPKGVSENAVAYDKKAYVSLETAQMMRQELNMGRGGSADEASYNSVIVKVDSQENVEQVERQIKKLTLNTQTNLQQKERLAEQFSIIKAVALGGGVFILIIASISIVVAMTMSTYQRRRQIGIMKVLGANLAQIRNMFIIEAALLGLLGGLLGILFSYWIVWGINGLIQSMSGGGQDAVIIFVPMMAIPVGMAFAILTGVISGIYPAVSASRTDALTAIRRD